MCGIFACTDQLGADVSDIAVEGLNRLVYRGYDSYGFAGTSGSALAITRSLGLLEEGVALAAASSVLGHTRWATHGGVSLDNCHPRVGSAQSFALSHNGVVENYRALMPNSTSDTDAIVHLLELSLEDGHDRLTAFQVMLDQLEGRNSVVALFDDGEIVAGRKGAPLYLAREHHRYFVASDLLSLCGMATLVREIEADEIVRITPEGIEISKRSGPVPVHWEALTDSSDPFSREGESHFMMKEVLEQWQVIPGGPQHEKLRPLVSALVSSRAIYVVGAGGAAIAAAQIARFLREVGGLNAQSIAAYETDDIRSMVKAGDFCLAISQSGETADTIEAVIQARELGCQVGVHTNMRRSTLSRMADIAVSADAGPEICVLSTKSAMAQIAFGYLLASACAGKAGAALSHLQGLSQSLADIEAVRVEARLIADRYCRESHIYVLGQGQFRETAQMAALNIKEASYIHAEAFSAGELKHGVLALIEAGSLVILYHPVEGRIHNIAAEVKTRGAKLLGISAQNNPQYDEYLPIAPGVDPGLQNVAALLPGQLLAYYLAVARGLNPDRPRNLAKSVTVL